MIEKGEKFRTFPVEGWFDCGKPETLLSTNKYLLEKHDKVYNVDGSIIIPPVFISDSSIIEHSVIGPYATISDGAVVRNSIVNNSIISFNAKVKNSLLKESIIGANAEYKGLFAKLNVGDSSSIVNE